MAKTKQLAEFQMTLTNKKKYIYFYTAKPNPNANE